MKGSVKMSTNAPSSVMSLSRRSSGHDHGRMSSMSSIDTGTINVKWFPQLYWIFVGSVVIAFTAGHLFNIILCRERLRAARQKIIGKSLAQRRQSRPFEALTALYREIKNAPLRLWSCRSCKTLSASSPSFGATALTLGNLILLVALCLYKIDPSNPSNFENIAYRCGFLSLGQIPLLFLLAGKHNIIGALTGHSYEQLNKYHRYASRTLLVIVTLHMGYWFADWAQYDYIGYQIKNDRHFTQTGLIAWAILVWIVSSSFAPIRRFSYELFYVQHILSFVAFMTMVFLHTPAEDHAWLWAGIAVFVLDRSLRAVYMIANSTDVFGRRASGSLKWACEAELTALPDQMTRVTIDKPRGDWRPGQHMVLICHTIAPLQGHPFTISSVPSDGKLEFMIKAKKGATRRLHDYALKLSLGLPTSENQGTAAKIPAFVGGAHGNLRSLRQFDSVVLLAGSSGASFTMPLLRDLVAHWKKPGPHRQSLKTIEGSSGLVTRHIRFVWVVRSCHQASWFAEKLNQAVEEAQHMQDLDSSINLQASIYVTCDDEFTEANERTTTADDRMLISEKQGLTNDRQWDTLEDDSRQTSLGECKRDLKGSKEKLAEDSTQVIAREVDPRSVSEKDVQTCGPNGTCCCRTTVMDEDMDAIAPAAICNCNCAHNNADNDSASSTIIQSRPTDASGPENSTPARSLSPRITLLSGRPHLESVVRRSMEQAEGESAVVVCGPRRMNEDARDAVVSLSDERAIGRGTGALGVWFHAEGYGW